MSINRGGSVPNSFEHIAFKILQDYPLMNEGNTVWIQHFLLNNKKDDSIQYVDEQFTRVELKGIDVENERFQNINWVKISDSGNSEQDLLGFIDSIEDLINPGPLSDSFIPKQVL